MTHEHIDTLIVGAGLSGIGAAVQLKKNCPERRFAILEGRQALGGTWDLFRYPGIRSDSDMYTLGYASRPWTDKKSIADGATILQYITDTARDNGVDQDIRYGHRVKQASWSTKEACWTVEIDKGPQQEAVQMTCNFLYVCSGYYNYAHGYTPDFAGIEAFSGTIVHPQQWPADLNYTGKRVVVIGSGATAVTLVPSMSDKAAHVTMLQRSPSYVLSRPAEDRFAHWLNRRLPAKIAYGITRWKNVLLGTLFFKLSKRHPERIKKMIIDGVRRSVGPNCDVEKHFTPSYKPWDQRLCLVPNSDLFKAIRKGRASVVTDHIDAFTEKGIRLRSGQELQADIIVTATGLDLLALGGIKVVVDGKAIVMNQTMSYKGMMLEGVPNFAYVIGYTNASWTLKADLTGDYICRLLNFMTRQGWKQCVAKRTDMSIQAESWIDFSSGYIQRSLEKFPVQGNKKPWRLHQNYAMDLLTLSFGAVDDGTMVFSKGSQL